MELHFDEIIIILLDLIKQHVRFIKPRKQLIFVFKKWVLLSFLSVVIFLPLSTKSQEPVLDELNILFQVQNMGPTEISAIIREQEVLLPVSDIFEFLKVRNTLSRGMDSISGFFLNPQATYLIDRAKNKIVFQGKTISLNAGDLIRTETNLYLLSKYFGEIFGLDCKFNFRSLSVNMSTNIELPVMRELRLASMRQNINRLYGEAKVDTVIKQRKPAFNFGMADWSVISTQQLGLTTDTRLNLALGTVIAGGEANAYLNFNTNEAFSEKQQLYYWRFVNNDNKILRQTTLGKITTDAISSVYNPVVGIRLTNTPTTYRRSFGTYPLSDYTNPGWMVELYVNNVLVDYKKADPSGFFNFEVPLVYGNSAIKLKFYGPWGEERSKEQQITIPFNFIPPKEFEYIMNAGMVEDSLNSVLLRSSMIYGISNAMTIGAGIEYLSSVTTGPVMPFVTLATRPLPNVLLSAEYVYGVRGKGLLSYQLPKNIQFEINYTKFKPGQKAVNFNYLEERKFILSFPVNPKGLFFYNRMSYDQIILPGTGYSTVEWLISGTLHGFSTNLTNYAMFIKDNNPYVYSNLSISYKLPYGIQAIPQVQYEYSHHELISARVGIEKYIFKNGFCSLTYENNFKNGLQSLQMSLRYDLPFAQSGMTVRQSNSQTTLTEMARGSLIIDSKNKYFEANNRVNVGKSGIVFAPFLDMNCNNKRDQGEPRAKGLNIRFSGGNSTENESDTTVVVLNLEPYNKYYVELDANSFDNVSWKLRTKSMNIIADPNILKLIEIPVSVVGEVSGTVYRKKGKTKEGQGRITLVIFDKKEKIVGRTMSEPDGYFSYLGLAPGEYAVRVDTVQTKKLNLTSTPAKQEFTIKMSRDGDIVEGMDFVLTSNLPEVITETEKTGIAPVKAESAVINETNAKVPVKAETIANPELKITSPVKTASPAKSGPTTAASVKKESSPKSETKATTPIKTEIPPKPQTKAATPVKVGPPASPPSKKYYFVQIGAFENVKNATQLAEKAGALIPYPVGVTFRNKLYRVRFGGFETESKSDECISLIDEAGLGKKGQIVLQYEEIGKNSPDELAIINKEYFIQTGAFYEKVNAEHYLKKMSASYPYPIVIMEEDGYFKVSFGPFKSLKEANKYRELLIKGGVDNFSRGSLIGTF